MPNAHKYILTAESCPAAPFALVVLWLGAAAVIVAAGGSRRAVASARRHLTRALVGDSVRKWTGAGARGGAGTQGGHQARDGAGAAARGQAHLLREVLRWVPVLL